MVAYGPAGRDPWSSWTRTQARRSHGWTISATGIGRGAVSGAGVWPRSAELARASPNTSGASLMTESGVPVQASMKIRIVVFAARDPHVDVAAEDPVVLVRPDRERRIRRPPVLTDQPAEVAETMPGEVEPERPLAEREIDARRGRAGVSQGSQASHAARTGVVHTAGLCAVGSERVQRREPCRSI